MDLIKSAMIDDCYLTVEIAIPEENETLLVEAEIYPGPQPIFIGHIKKRSTGEAGFDLYMKYASGIDRILRQELDRFANVDA